MITHEIDGKVFGLFKDITEYPFANPKELKIKKTHYFIDGIEVDKKRMELEYYKSVQSNES